MSALDPQLCEVLSLADLGRLTRRYAWCGNGAPSCPRPWLAHAFMAKSVYQFPITSALIDTLKSRPFLRQLCGWESDGEIPSKPTFSRAFTEFAQDQLPEQIHERPVAKSVPAAPAAPRKRGRPKQGEARPPVVTSGESATAKGIRKSHIFPTTGNPSRNAVLQSAESEICCRRNTCYILPGDEAYGISGYPDLRPTQKRRGK